MENDIREDIQETASNLFLKYGLRSVSINEICKELRISKKTFYAHFSQKEALIESIMIKKDEENAKQLVNKFYSQKNIECLEGINTIDQLIRISNMSFGSFRMVQQSTECDNFMFDLRKYYPEIYKTHLQRIHIGLHKHITQVIDKGIREGIFREDAQTEILTDLITFQYMATVKYILERFDKAQQKDAASMMVDSQLRILCNEKGFEYYRQRLQEQKTASENVSSNQ